MEEEAKEALLSALQDAGANPPALAELFTSCSIDPALGRKAIGSLEKAGSAQRVTKELCFVQPVIDRFETAVRAYLEEHGEASAADLKDAMQTSRKYAIPLLEYFDDKGVTHRNGDVRVLAR